MKVSQIDGKDSDRINSLLLCVGGLHVFLVLLWVLSSSLRPKTCRYWGTFNSKCPIDMNVSVNGCLLECALCLTGQGPKQLG